MAEQAHSAPRSAGLTGHPRRWAILARAGGQPARRRARQHRAQRRDAYDRRPGRTGSGRPRRELEWAINSYTLVFAGLLFTAGVFGDRIGRRRMLVIGLVLFGLASLASAYAQTPTQLIWARALMGIGGAAVMPSTLSIISNVFDPRERAKAIGVWAGAVGLAVAIGPVVGGALLEQFWWGSVFLINVPIIVVGLVARAGPGARVAQPQPGPDSTWSASCCPSPAWSRWCTASSTAASTASAGSVVWASDPGRRWRSWRRSSGTSGAATIRRWTSGLFRDPRFSAAVGSIGLVFFAAMGTLFFLAFYLQLVRGLLAAAGRPADDPVRGGAADLRAAERRHGPAVRAEGGVRGRSGAGDRRPRRLRVRRRQHADLGADRADLRPGRGHGQRDPAGDRVDHVVAAAGEGRRRLGRSATRSGRSAARSAWRCSARCWRRSTAAEIGGSRRGAAGAGPSARQRVDLRRVRRGRAGRAGGAAP